MSAAAVRLPSRPPTKTPDRIGVEWFSDFHILTDQLARYDCDQVSAPSLSIKEPFRDLLFAVFASGVQGASRWIEATHPCARRSLPDGEDFCWLMTDDSGGLRFGDLCSLFNLDQAAVRQAVLRGSFDSNKLSNLWVASQVRRMEPKQRGMEKSVDLRGTKDGKISAWNRKFAEA